MTISEQSGASALRVLVAAERPLKAWQLWLATRLERAGFRVELLETDNRPAAEPLPGRNRSWQAREESKIASWLDACFERTALETVRPHDVRSQGTPDIAICADAPGYWAEASAAKVGGASIQLAAHPDLTQMQGKVEWWSRLGGDPSSRSRGARIVRPQVAPGDVFETVWLRLLVEASESAVEIARNIGRDVSIQGHVTDCAEPSATGWSDYAAYRLQGRGRRSPSVLQTGFLG